MINTKLILSALLGIVTLFTSAYAANNDMKEYHSIIIDSFDDPQTRIWFEDCKQHEEPRVWTVKGSCYACEGQPELKYIPGSPTKRSFNCSSSQEGCILGVRSRFDYKGYNYFEVAPVVNDKLGFMIPGNTRILSVWVWGCNYNYSLEAHLQDHNGKVYVIPMGNLRFLGWRNLSVRIPDRYTQDPYNPWGEPLRFLRFVVRTAPNERVHDFQVYFDELRVLTLKDQSPYSGGELFEPQKINQIWNNAE